MTDENANTADLTDREVLERILRRLETLEAKSDDRARETRPLLDHLIKEMIETRESLAERMAALEQESKNIRRELGLLREDIRHERLERAELAERVDDMERRPN